MKKLLKNIQFLTFITFIFASMLSCSNLMGKKSANESVAAKKDAAYITLNVADIGRNVNPVIEVDALTNLELKGTKTGAIEQTLGKWDAVSNLQSARLAVSTGEWSFTLTAKAGGVNGTRLSGTISKQIELGDNALNFVLSISDDGAGEENRVGSFEITLNYANAENADKVSYVTASLENMAGISVTGFAQPVQLTPASNSVSFAANDIPAGTYRARVKFYAASNQTGVADFEIASYRELVQISSGLTSSATRKIESFDNLYTITYHLNGGSLSAGTTLQESFTRKSTITLPTSTTISRDYYNFGGWYTDSNFTTGNEISTVSNITTNLDVYAKFTIKDYSISFISNGGTILESIPSSYTYVSDTILLPEPQRNNYVFRGWFLEEDFSGERQRELATGSYGEKTYYAKWLEHSGPDDGFVLVKGGFIEGRDNESQYKGVFPEGRRVELSNFYICDHEVTQAEYEKYCWYTQEIPGRSQNANFGLGADYPVYFVSAYDAVVYCNLKSMAEGLTPCYRLYAETDPKRWNEIKVENGKLSCNYTESNNNTYWNNDLQCDMKASGYRLPTEAEWEYAARGGHETYGTPAFNNDFPTNPNIGNDLNLVAWYDRNSYGGTHEVKTKAPNALGLYDMSGNVWEFCWDWYDSNVRTGYEVDPSGALSGTNRVIRGGSWYHDAGWCSVYYRHYGSPFGRWKDDGFRLVRSACSLNGINLISEHGNVPEKLYTNENICFEQLPTPEEIGWKFMGWYSDSSFSEASKVTDGFTVTEGLTLYAKWLEKPKYTISFESEHGTAPEEIVMLEGERLYYSQLVNLEEDGWIFKGWYRDSSFTETSKVTGNITLQEDLILYAKWLIDDGFIFVEGGTVVGSNDYNQNYTGAFPSGRTVTLSSFYMSDHELTQGEYETYCCYTTSTPSSSCGVGADYPAYYVSWYDAIVYCNLKSMAEGLTPCYALSGEKDPKKWTGIKSSSGKYSCSYTSSNSTWNAITCDMTASGYRLPTEAEWEYAARGGQETYGTAAFANFFAGATTTNYSASSNSDLDSVGWYMYNICNNGVTAKNAASSGNAGYGIHEVKQKAPNALGLYDMSGNVYEWCWDWYSSSVGTGSVTDPCGASSGSYRLRRGGSWFGNAIYCSVSYRNRDIPYYRYDYDGFRLVRSAQ